MNDFNRKTLNRLAKRGITVVGVQAILGEGEMPEANATRGYILNDNGTQRVRTLTQVLELAE